MTIQPLSKTNNINRVVLPLAYLPSIDQYCFIVQADEVFFEICETYPKQTCRNRANIITANGTHRLSIPVVKPQGNNTKTSEVLIKPNDNWNIIHWRAITSAYNKSPFFLYYRDLFEEIYRKPEGPLIDFNLSLIRMINKIIKTGTNFQVTDEFIACYTNVLDERKCNKAYTISKFEIKPYSQVFNDRFPFIANLSIIDLLFNEGPHTLRYLLDCRLKQEY